MGFYSHFLAVQQERQPNSARIMKPHMDEYGMKTAMNNDFLASLIVAEPCRDAMLRTNQVFNAHFPQPDISSSVYCSSPEAIFESAARLLFMSVKWARNIPSFVNLPFRDQVILLEEGWRELFIMGAVQWSLPLEVAPLLAAAGMHVENTQAEKIVGTMANIRQLQEINSRFRALQVCEAEFACLKAIVLFKSGTNTLIMGSQVLTLIILLLSIFPLFLFLFSFTFFFSCVQSYLIIQPLYSKSSLCAYK